MRSVVSCRYYIDKGLKNEFHHKKKSYQYTYLSNRLKKAFYGKMDSNSFFFLFK